MKKIVFFITVVLISLVILKSNVMAQDIKDKTIVEISSKDVDPNQTRAMNPNIKIKAPTNDKNPMPASFKKGEKEGEDCEIIFDNYTGYFIEVYLDGEYKGTIGDWGTLYVTKNAGYTKVYCITTGGTKEWEVKGDCDGNFLWKIK